MNMKKYFKNKKEALQAAESRNGHMFRPTEDVHKMPKGTRHHGMYYVGSYLEWLNFAN